MEDLSVEELASNLSTYKEQLREVKKLIKEKKDDAGISEYIDMEKELQEVSSFLILSCNVIPHARVATRQIHRINDFHKWMLDFSSDFWGMLLSIPFFFVTRSHAQQGSMKRPLATEDLFWGI